VSSTAVQSRHLGMAGSIVGLFALIIAVLPHWVLPAVFPPPSLDQVIVETGHRLKERLIARAKGIEYEKPSHEKSASHRWSDACSIAAISLGLIAIACAVFSLFRREEKLYAGLSATTWRRRDSVRVVFHRHRLPDYHRDYLRRHGTH
jgi:hypothetical protein